MSDDERQIAHITAICRSLLRPPLEHLSEDIAHDIWIEHQQYSSHAISYNIIRFRCLSAMRDYYRRRKADEAYAVARDTMHPASPTDRQPDHLDNPIGLTSDCQRQLLADLLQRARLQPEELAVVSRRYFSEGKRVKYGDRPLSNIERKVLRRALVKLREASVEFL